MNQRALSCPLTNVNRGLYVASIYKSYLCTFFFLPFSVNCICFHECVLYLQDSQRLGGVNYIRHLSEISSFWSFIHLHSFNLVKYCNERQLPVSIWRTVISRMECLTNNVKWLIHTKRCGVPLSPAD